jgi:hypothetical protein
VAALIVAAALSACSSDLAPSPTVSPDYSLGELGAPECDPASPILGDVVQGTGVGSTTAFGLLELTGTGVTVAKPIKLVVRMTGSGDLSADVTAPDGSTRELDWGPEAHGGSNFDRPGDEWGLGFTFDAPGCWAIDLHRAGGEEATFWLVAAD